VAIPDADASCVDKSGHDTLIVDGTGRIHGCTATMEDLFGTAQGQLVGRPISMFIAGILLEGSSPEDNGRYTMFKNLKISMKLAIAFGLVLLLLIAISATSSLRLMEMNGNTENIAKNLWPKVQLLQDGLAGVNDIGIAARDLALAATPEAQNAAKARVLDGRAAIGKAWEALTPKLLMPKGKEMMQAILQARERYIAVQNQIIKLAEEGKKAEAVTYLDTDFRPAATEYRKRVNALIKYQSDLLDSVGVDSAKAAETGLAVNIGLSIGAVLIALIGAFLVTRSITSPLNQAVNAANELAQGNLTVEIAADSRDETGQLMASMANLSGKLTQIISEVKTAGDALNNAAGQVSATAQSLSQSSSPSKPPASKRPPPASSR
jgi:methyl-accepting chemotaxis protein